MAASTGRLISESGVLVVWDKWRKSLDAGAISKFSHSDGLRFIAMLAEASQAEPQRDAADPLLSAAIEAVGELRGVVEEVQSLLISGTRRGAVGAWTSHTRPLGDLDAAMRMLARSNRT